METKDVVLDSGISREETDYFLFRYPKLIITGLNMASMALIILSMPLVHLPHDFVAIIGVVPGFLIIFGLLTALISMFLSLIIYRKRPFKKRFTNAYIIITILIFSVCLFAFVSLLLFYVLNISTN